MKEWINRKTSQFWEWVVSLPIQNRNSIVVIGPVIFCLFILGFTIGNSFEIFEMNRSDAYDLLKEILSNYVSALGLGLAILAVVFAILQLAYKKLSIVQLVIESSFFIPLFYFGIINVVICALFIVFSSSELSIIADKVFVRITVIENYCFIIFIIGLCIVFLRTIRFVSFTQITLSYINNLRKKVINEQKGKLTDQPEDNLQLYSSELKNEATFCIEENNTMILSKILDLLSFSIELNPNSVLLRNYDRTFVNWFYKSYKSEGEEPLRELMSTWFRQYLHLAQNNPSRLDVVNNIHLLLIEKAIQENDPHFGEFVVECFAIRLHEIALIIIYQSIHP